MILRSVVVHPPDIEGVGRTGESSWCPPEGVVASFRLMLGSSGPISSGDKACVEVGDSGWLCC
jgi:hypothetical protein